MARSLPEEILHDILYRLPPKSLIRCTSVCKPWNSMIKNPSFIRTHLNRTIYLNNQFDTHLLLLYCVRTIYSDSNDDCDEDPVETHCNLRYDNLVFDEYCKIEFPIAPKEELCNAFLHVTCVCNGLVLLAGYKEHFVYTFMLCNPSMRKSVTLPKPHLNFETNCVDIGFGFDAVTNDYKVVRLITVRQWEDENTFYQNTFYEVYSLAGSSWSDPRSLDHACDFNYIRNPQAFVNGAIHWEASGSECFILVFDVGSDSFHRIMIPKNFRSSGLDMSISGYGKSIALSGHCFTTIEPCLEIWVMKEYGMEESWTKLTTVSPPGPQRGVCYRPLCFRKSGDVVLVPVDGFGDENDDDGRRYELVCLDLVNKQFKNLGIHGYRFYYAESYVESLVLLDKTDAVSY